MDESKKISVDYCKKLLKKGGLDYTNEQVKNIRDFMYLIGEIDYNYFIKFIAEHEKKINPIH